MARRIKKAKINKISLVPRGANQLPVLYKADEDRVQFEPVLKFHADKGELLAVVYAPESEDSQGDIASAEVIKDMMYDAAKDGLPNINIQHKGADVPRDQAYVAESFIVQKGDERFSEMKDYNGNPVDVTGGWATVIKIEDEGLRKAYRDGEWNGVSMEGSAVVEQQKEDSILSYLKKILPSFTPTPKEDDQVNSKELTAALAENNKALIEGLTKALTPAESENKKEVKKEEIPFEGDPTNRKDVEAHLAKIQTAKIDWSDAEAVAKYAETLKSPEEQQKAQIAKLEKQLNELRKGSNQPDKTSSTDADGDNAEIKKQSDLILASMPNAKKED